MCMIRINGTLIVSGSRYGEHIMTLWASLPHTATHTFLGQRAALRSPAARLVTPASPWMRRPRTEHQFSRLLDVTIGSKLMRSTRIQTAADVTDMSRNRTSAVADAEPGRQGDVVSPTCHPHRSGCSPPRSVAVRLLRQADDRLCSRARPCQRASEGTPARPAPLPSRAVRARKSR
jgi:hypothetical protein